MRMLRPRFTVRQMMAVVAIASLVIAGLIMIEARLRRARRDTEIQRALVQSLRPPGWWPLDWRQEFDTSLTIEGSVSVAGKPVGAGTVTFILAPGDRVFSAKIDKGRYSLKQDRMPTGLYRIEVKSADGPESRTIKGQSEMPMDQGFHRMNLAF